MAVSDEFIAYVLDELEGLGELHYRRMFGGAGLYWEDVFFGVMDDDVLYLKVNELTIPQYEKRGAKPFQPYGQGSYSMSYYHVPVDIMEDREELHKWAKAAIEVALRRPAKRKKEASQRTPGEGTASRREAKKKG